MIHPPTQTSSPTKNLQQTCQQKTIYNKLVLV
uniref:Uncharacterized protein n=1 Tax=Arundo donax TaxID=35708 RepID=A0A0A8ZGB0_ARUDO